MRLFREVFAPDVHSGPPRGKLNDGVSFLWRWELAGHPRDTEAWRMIHDFAHSAFPRAGAAFSDLHIAVAQAVAGDDAALEARRRRWTSSLARVVIPRAPSSGGVARFRRFRKARFFRCDRRA